MRASGSRLSTYSVAFDFDDTGELPAAAKLAKQLGTEHHELFVKADEIAGLVTTLVHCHDEPFADAANIPLYLATRQLRSAVKVVLQVVIQDHAKGFTQRVRRPVIQRNIQIV